MQCRIGGDNLNAIIGKLPQGLGNLEDTIETNDQPGIGTNTLEDGRSRIWKESATGVVYLITKIDINYYGVELGIFQ